MDAPQIESSGQNWVSDFLFEVGLDESFEKWLYINQISTIPRLFQKYMKFLMHDYSVSLFHMCMIDPKHVHKFQKTVVTCAMVLKTEIDTNNNDQ